MFGQVVVEKHVIVPEDAFSFQQLGPGIGPFFYQSPPLPEEFFRCAVSNFPVVEITVDVLNDFIRKRVRRIQRRKTLLIDELPDFRVCIYQLIEWYCDHVKPPFLSGRIAQVVRMTE